MKGEKINTFKAAVVAYFKIQNLQPIIILTRYEYEGQIYFSSFSQVQHKILAHGIKYIYISYLQLSFEQFSESVNA
jgi:hypothetical protein